MIRVLIGVFIILGAVGHEDYMMEINATPDPLGYFLLKVLVGIGLAFWGVIDLQKNEKNLY